MSLDPQEAATLFYAGHPLAYDSDPTSPFVCGQWFGTLAMITKIPFDDQAGAVTYFTDNPVDLAAPPVAPAFGVPPQNIDAPYVVQEGDTISCTVGNWDGEPTSYDYQWRQNGDNIGNATGGVYTIVIPDDVDQTIDCALTANNAFGSATVISNSVVVTDPGAQTQMPGRYPERLRPPPQPVTITRTTVRRG